MLLQTQYSICAPEMPSNFKRDFKQDMKLALDLLLSFKEELDKLHPDCRVLISKILQEKTHY